MQRRGKGPIGSFHAQNMVKVELVEIQTFDYIAQSLRLDARHLRVDQFRVHQIVALGNRAKQLFGAADDLHLPICKHKQKKRVNRTTVDSIRPLASRMRK